MLNRESICLQIQQSEFEYGQNFFCGGNLRSTLIFQTTDSITKNWINTNGEFQLSHRVKGTYLQIGPMTSLRVWDDVISTLLRNSSNLLQYQLTDLTYGGVRALIGNRPRRKEGPSGDRYEDNRTG